MFFAYMMTVFLAFYGPKVVSHFNMIIYLMMLVSRTILEISMSLMDPAITWPIEAAPELVISPSASNRKTISLSIYLWVGVILCSRNRFQIGILSTTGCRQA